MVVRFENPGEWASEWEIIGERKVVYILEVITSECPTKPSRHGN